MGKKKGTLDRRGLVTLKGLEFIAATRPRIVVLEQVAALLHKNHQKIWVFMQKIFSMLEYDLMFKVLNTKDLGLAQSRPRLYVLCVAIECTAAGQKEEMLLPRKQNPPLHEFLNKLEVGAEVLPLPGYESKIGPNLWKKGYVLDVGASPHPMTNVCPCLTYTRLKESGYYIPKLKRRLSCDEAGRLQGVPSKVLSAMKAMAIEKNLPKTAVDAALGDAMSVNVLMLVLRRGLDRAGLTKLSSSKDYWLMCPADKCHQLSDRLFEKFGSHYQ